jgi:hypothetical protein
MISESLDEVTRYLAIVAFVAIIALTGWVFNSYLEASAFNRATGKNASTVDAMFTELRVVGPVDK